MSERSRWNAARIAMVAGAMVGAALLPGSAAATTEPVKVRDFVPRPGGAPPLRGEAPTAAILDPGGRHAKTPPPSVERLADQPPEPVRTKRRTLPAPVVKAGKTRTPAHKLLPLDNDMVHPSDGPSQFGAELFGVPHYGSGFTTFAPSADYSQLRARVHYTLRLVTTAEGNVEDLRSEAQIAASAVQAATGGQVNIAVASGTVADTVPDREPVTGEIVLSVDSTSGCSGSWAGCAGPRRLLARSRDRSTVVRGGRVWIHPAVLAYTSREQAHVVAHEIGHALGLDHYDSVFGGATQTMHSGTYNYSNDIYRTGDVGGFQFLATPWVIAGRSAATTDSGGNRYVYSMSGDGKLREARKSGSTWTEQYINVDIVGSPSAIEANGFRQVWARGANGNLHQINWVGSSPWIIWDTGFAITGDPTVVGNYIYMRGANGNLWEVHWTGSNWTWTDIGVALHGTDTTPTVIVAGGRRQIWARGANGNLWQINWVGSAPWIIWDTGLATLGEPTVSGNEVYVRGPNGNLWEMAWTGSNWTFADFGVGVLGAPSVVRGAGSNKAVWAYGTTNTLWSFAFNGSWSYWNTGWAAFGPPFGTGPGNDVYFRDAEDHLHELSWSGSTWLHSDLGLPGGFPL